MRDFVSATNDHDSDKLCDELLSPRLHRRVHRRQGGRHEACKKQLDAVKGLRLSLVDIRADHRERRQGQVVAVLQVQGQRQRRVFQLEKHDGDWKLAGGSSG